MPTVLEKANTLRALHQGPRLLVLANVWDCASARIVAKAGLPALATSSAAVAAIYGYPDGERISALVREIRGPLNVLISPKSPPIPELERLGVRRASVGSGMARAAYGLAATIVRELLDSGTYRSLAQGAIPYAEMQQLLE